MKNSLTLLFAFTSLIACNNSEKSNASQEPIIETAAPEVVGTDEATAKAIQSSDDGASKIILGTWTGEMNMKVLTIVFEKINGTELTGYNVLGTNKRNLKGTFTESSCDQPCSKAFDAILNEPGDDNWDGVFSLKLVGYEDQKETAMGPDCVGNMKGVEAIGNWKSNNGKRNMEISLIKEL